MKLVSFLILSLLPVMAYADAGPRPSFCQGVALMSSQLQQRLQQGQDLPAAIEGVLDDTEAPPERDGPRQFLGGVSGLIGVLDMPPLATQSFVLLSCLQADIFGDEAARETYKKNLPFYLEGARLCARTSSDADGLQQCMIKAFILPAPSH